MNNCFLSWSKKRDWKSEQAFILIGESDGYVKRRIHTRDRDAICPYGGEVYTIAQAMDSAFLESFGEGLVSVGSESKIVAGTSSKPPHFFAS